MSTVTTAIMRPSALGLLFEAPLAVPQALIGLFTSLPAQRVFRPFFKAKDQRRSWVTRLFNSVMALVGTMVLTMVQIGLTFAISWAVVLGVFRFLNPAGFAALDFAKLFSNQPTMDPDILILRGIVQTAVVLISVLLDRPFLDSFDDLSAEFPTLRFILKYRIALTRAVIRIGATMILMGMSLLPLSVLLLALPAANPSEAVLADSVPPARSNLRGMFRRIAGLLAGFGMLLVLLAFAVETLTLLRLPGDTFYGIILRNMLPSSLTERLPYALIEYWPHVLLLIYMIDLAILFVIGKVPHKYSWRNMVVRWRITAMTGLAFVVVLFMLTFMLAFVNGMTKLTEASGIPGNVMILSEGSTDELFSNLAYGDVGNLERIVVTEDENDRPLPRPITVKSIKRDGKQVRLLSRETYCVVNQLVPNQKDKRRFVQLRIIVDVDVSAAVHNLELVDKTHEWFTNTGVTKADDGSSRIQCVIGQGVAATLGEDIGKKSLEPGDTFELADLIFEVVGIMKTEGTTYGSEVWCSNVNTVTIALGKKSYTTCVARVSDDSEASARAFAYHLRNRYQLQKLKAVTEKEYFADLNKNNQQTLYAVMVMAVVMAIGGIFGVMNTMFAAIAQRTKDIGVLRLLGFKRWQVLVSFLLESMIIAIIGGIIGIALGYFCDGFSVTSIAGSGHGGGKTVTAKLIVDRDVMMIGMLFTLIMGRLGGLVPALSAMRLEILESLR